MTELAKNYYSKVLLFGEYTVTLGSGALALPYNGYCGYWDFGNATADQKNGLDILFQYLKNSENLKHLYNIKKFKEEIDKGLFFSSDIPRGYGLGSSGALVAAVYDRYFLKKTTDKFELKKILAETECAFHGSSSGVDPLVSYLSIPVLIDSYGQIMEVSHEIDKRNIYLLDTGIVRKTDTYIDIFKNKLKTDPSFTTVINQLSAINQKAINAAMTNDSNALFSSFGMISSLQFKYFGEMIPARLSGLWYKGITSKEYYLKLCGAGGGGMMLCMVKSTIELPVGIKSFPYRALK